MSPRKSAGFERASIFLNGHYSAGDRLLARKKLRETKKRPLVIAVDGGLAFVQKEKIRPDIWLSDLDSAPPIRKGFLKDTQIYIFPSEKDYTDMELALVICRHRQIKAATVFGWYDRTEETDHLLGNLLLGSKFAAGRGKIDLEFVAARQRVIPLRNGRLTINESRGRRLSVVPLSPRVIVTLSGTKYHASGLKIGAGDTITLRNEIVKNKSVVTVIGSVLVIIGQ